MQWREIPKNTAWNGVLHLQPARSCGLKWLRETPVYTNELVSECFLESFASIAKGEKGIITQEKHSCPLMCVTIVEKVVLLSKRMKVVEQRRGRPW